MEYLYYIYAIGTGISVKRYLVLHTTGTTHDTGYVPGTVTTLVNLSIQKKHTKRFLVLSSSLSHTFSKQTIDQENLKMTRI